VTKSKFTLSIAIAVGVLVSSLACPCRASGLFSELQQPYNVAQARIRFLNNSIGALLLQMPSVSSQGVSQASVCETYLLVVRQYFKGSLSARDAALKSVLVLYGERLLRTYPEFSALVKHVLAHPTALVAANSALVKFQRATMTSEPQIDTWPTLEKYQKQVLDTLAPLVTAESVHAKTTVIWPTSPARTFTAIAPLPAKNLPPISQTIASLPEINIAAQLRNVFDGVLRQIQTRLLAHPGDTKAMHYYRIILRCLGLAEHLQRVTVLSLSTQKAFNHRLMLALLFFKDPRTRDGALRRLEFIGRIVDSMELISAVPVGPDDRAILTHRLHHIMTQLDRREHNDSSLQKLDAIDSFLKVAVALNHLNTKSVQSPYLNASNRIKLAGRLLTTTTIKNLRSNVSIHRLRAAQMQLQVIAENLERVTSMPAARAQALLYHPQSASGVTRNTVLWARAISVNPAVTTNAAEEYDRFSHTLALLASIHLQLLHHAPTSILEELSAHQYLRFIALFRTVQQNIINSLSTPHPAPSTLITQLHQQMQLLRAVHRLAWLVDQKQYLTDINIWGAWHWNRAARQMWLQQMMEVIAHRFERATGIKSASEAWISFKAASPAIQTMYRAVRAIAPNLHADTALWCVAYMQVTVRPPPDAIASAQWTNYTQACMSFDVAAASSHHGRFQPAIDEFQRGNHILAAIPMNAP